MLTKSDEQEKSASVYFLLMKNVNEEKQEKKFNDQETKTVHFKNPSKTKGNYALKVGSLPSARIATTYKATGNPTDHKPIVLKRQR